MSNHGFQPVLQSSVPCLGTIELYIETLTGTAFEMRVSPFETIISIKSKIQRVEGIPISHQHLIYNSQELEDNACLMDYSIQDGATLKLVLAMKGGPINTRRVSMYDDTAWKEMQELMELNREEMFERLPSGGQVTLLVFRDGDQINFYRVVEKEDGTFSPLSESWSGSSIRNLFTEDDDEEIEKRIKENAMTMSKMQELRQKMENMSVRKRPRKMSQVSSGCRPTSRTGGQLSYHTRHGKVKTPPSRNLKLPPVTNREKQKNESFLQESVGHHHKFRKSNSLVSHETAVHQARTSKLTEQKTHFSRHSHDWHRKSALGNHRKTSNTGSSSNSTLIHQDYFTEINESVNFKEKITPDVSSVTKPVDCKNRNYSAYRKKSLHRVRRGHQASSSSAVKMQQDERHIEELNETVVVDSKCLIDEKHDYSFPVMREMQDCADAKVLPCGFQSNETKPRVLSKHFDIGNSERPKTSPVDFPLRRDNIASPAMSTISEKLHLNQSDQKAYEICEILSHRKSKSQSQEVTRLLRSCSKDLDTLDEDDHLAIVNSDNGNASEHSRTPRHTRDFLSDILMEPKLQHISPVEKSFSCEKHDTVRDLMKTPDSQTSNYSDQKFEARLQRRLSASRQGKLNSAHKISHAAKKKLCRNRCSECNKKIGITTTYSCHCGNLFCAAHRYAEVHHCTFDYKSEGRKMIEQANPLITASKLPKI